MRIHLEAEGAAQCQQAQSENIKYRNTNESEVKESHRLNKRQVHLCTHTHTPTGLLH